MAKNVPAEIDQLPSYLTKYAPEELDNSEYSVPGGAPMAIVSIRGGTWKVRYQGEEGILRDEDGYPRPYFDGVLVKPSKIITKTFYLTPYKDGSNTAPDCMSSNGVTPDVTSPHIQHHECTSCQHNQFNTALGNTGGKRCQDNKRFAVLPANDLVNETLGGAMLLRIPPGSFTKLREYEMDCTKRKRIIALGITRMSFDPEAAGQKILFQWQGYLPEDSADVVMECRNSPHVDRILNITHSEIAQAVGTVPEEEEASEEDAPATVASTTARERVAAAQAAQAKPAPKPVTKPVVVTQSPAKAAPAKVVPIKKVTAAPVETPVEKKRREAFEAIEAAKRAAAELEAMEAEEEPTEEAEEEIDGATEAETAEDIDPADELLDDLDRQIGAIPG